MLNSLSDRIFFCQSAEVGSFIGQVGEKVGFTSYRQCYVKTG
ncbi:hypothetical protein [Nostoc sp. NIES-3756]|nr:hypothetical protein [Nostoc sp. NIES-3756]